MLDLTVPLELLGMPSGATPPPRVLVRIAGADLVSERAGGMILHNSTLEDVVEGVFQPVTAGLFDELTFGFLPREADGGVKLEAFGEELTTRPQVRDFGGLVLDNTILHPWLQKYGIAQVAEPMGLDPEEVEAILRGDLGVDPDGDLRPVPKMSETADHKGWTFGGDALADLGADPAHLLDRLPVLPAGLRPAKRGPAGLLVHDHTLAYQEVWDANQKVRDVRSQTGHARVVSHAVVDLQRTVYGLFLDGVHALDRNIRYGSLADRLRGFDESAIADLRAVTDASSFVATLRGPLFVWRAVLEASCLEVVLLDDDGLVDEAHRTRSLVDSSAHRTHDVYERTLSDRWTPDAQVVHGSSDASPHIDVYQFNPRDPSTATRLCITGGMRTRPMSRTGCPPQPPPPPGVPMRIELACALGQDITRDEALTIRQELLLLARYPYRSGAWFGHGHDIGIGAPLLQDSSLTSWLIFRREVAWQRDLLRALPGAPTVHWVTAITENEVRFKRDHGAQALLEELYHCGGLQISHRS